MIAQPGGVPANRVPRGKSFPSIQNREQYFRVAIEHLLLWKQGVTGNEAITPFSQKPLIGDVGHALALARSIGFQVRQFVFQRQIQPLLKDVEVLSAQGSIHIFPTRIQRQQMAELTTSLGVLKGRDKDKAFEHTSIILDVLGVMFISIGAFRWTR